MTNYAKARQECADADHPRGFRSGRCVTCGAREVYAPPTTRPCPECDGTGKVATALRRGKCIRCEGTGVVALTTDDVSVEAPEEVVAYIDPR